MALIDVPRSTFNCNRFPYSMRTCDVIPRNRMCYMYSIDITKCIAGPHTVFHTMLYVLSTKCLDRDYQMLIIKSPCMGFICEGHGSWSKWFCFQFVVWLWKNLLNVLLWHRSKMNRLSYKIMLSKNSVLKFKLWNETHDKEAWCSGKRLEVIYCELYSCWIFSYSRMGTSPILRSGKWR